MPLGWKVRRQPWRTRKCQRPNQPPPPAGSVFELCWLSFAVVLSLYLFVAPVVQCRRKSGCKTLTKRKVNEWISWRSNKHFFSLLQCASFADYYKTLGVSSKASSEELKAAYVQLGISTVLTSLVRHILPTLADKLLQRCSITRTRRRRGTSRSAARSLLK